MSEYIRSRVSLLVGHAAAATYGGQIATHVTHGQRGTGGVRIRGGDSCNLRRNPASFILDHILWHHSIGVVHNKFIEPLIPL